MLDLPMHETGPRRRMQKESNQKLKGRVQVLKDFKLNTYTWDMF